MTLANFARRHGRHVRRGLILASLAVIVAAYAADRGCLCLSSDWPLQMETV